MQGKSPLSTVWTAGSGVSGGMVVVGGATVQGKSPLNRVGSGGSGWGNCAGEVPSLNRGEWSKWRYGGSGCGNCTGNSLSQPGLTRGGGSKGWFTICDRTSEKVHVLELRKSKIVCLVIKLKKLVE